MSAAVDFAQALSVLAEALVSEKRVLVVGDASLGLHDLLSELGARIVHVFDPDGHRALAQPPPTQRGTVLRALPEGDFDVRDGAFDLALVPDIGSIAEAPALLARLRRVVGQDGAVLCAARNVDAPSLQDAPGAIGYYELYDLVSLQFAHVRMIAAMPFVGMTLAELGQDEVDSAVRVDTQLAGERPAPLVFAALAAQTDVAVDAYAVIELAAALVSVEEPAPETTAALAQARLRAEYLESQVDELASTRAAGVRAEEEARRALDALEVERERVLRLQRDLDEKGNRRTDERDTSAELAEQLAEAQLRAAALEEGIELAENTIRVQRQRITEVEAQLENVAPPRDDEAAHTEVVALETKLRERGEVVAALEVELTRRDKLVRELVARLETEPGSHEGENLTRKLDELAHLAARQKSELEARAWRIAELERAVTSTVGLVSST